MNQGVAAVDVVARLRLFRGRPRWAVLSLIAILATAALLYTWSIGYSGVSTYYAASAVSMSRSWQALLVGALNPSASVTLDKLSGFLLPQALAVRLFGVHAWALSLPQAIEGIVTVLAAWALGIRWRGPVIGVLAAAGTAFTPMLAAMFGRPSEDSLLTMATALAMVAAQRAVIAERGKWMLVAAVWVGVGFQAKMLQAWFIVPAVLCLYLLGSRSALRRRLLVAAACVGATVLVSVSWITIIQLLPAGLRPYADGTTDDNMFTMVFGYNGIDRVLPGVWPGSVPQLGAASGGGSAHGATPEIARTRMLDAAHSPLKLLLPELATQLGWLYPAALLGAFLEIALLLPAVRRRTPFAVLESAPRRRLDRGMAVVLVVWIAVTVIAFVPSWVPHSSYFGPIAVPLALLAAAAGVATFRWWREQIPGWRRFATALVLMTAAWQAVVIATGPAALRWASLPVGAGGLAVAVVLALVRRPSSRLPAARRSRRAPLAAAAMLLALGLVPAAWSSAVIVPGLGGSASDSYAGPRIAAPPSRTAAASAAAVATRRHPSLRPPFAAARDLALTPEQHRLVDYVTARTGNEPMLFATDTLAIAVSVLLETHHDALPMGGFSRQAPTPTLAQLRHDLKDGELRFVLLADRGAPQPTSAAVRSARDWVRGRCAPVLHGEFRAGTSQHQTLFDCSAAA